MTTIYTAGLQTVSLTPTERTEVKKDGSTPGSFCWTTTSLTALMETSFYYRSCFNALRVTQATQEEQDFQGFWRFNVIKNISA